MKSTILALIIVSCLSTVNAEDEESWLVVAPDAFHEALKPLVEHREKQGMRAHVSSASIDKALEDISPKPDFLLLIGDHRQPQAPRAQTKQLYRWRATQAEDYASDSAWGDLDGDGIPEVAVGRIPTRTPKQLAEVIQKIIAFEEQPMTAEDLQMPVWAGNPNYGNAFEASMASALLRQTLQTKAPAWAETWVMIGNEQDPLSGWAPDQPALYNAQMQQGGILNTMMGHGNATFFLSMFHEEQVIGYTTDHAQLLTEGSPAAPLVIFACDCGRFDHTTESLAESMLFAPGGPVATIAATTQSHPLPNYYSSVSLLKQLNARTARLGTLWVNTQKEAYSMKEFLVEAVLKDIEGKLEEKLDTPSIRADHLLLYALLGDPATRLRMPLPLEVELTKADDVWHWSVKKPHAAEGLEVSHRSAPKAFVMKSEKTLPDVARKQFEDANQSLAYTPLASLTADEAWTGKTQEPGTLRFIVSGHQLYSEAVVLK